MAKEILLRGEDYNSEFVCDEVAGQISSAVHEAYELICITGGMAEYWVEDQYYRASKGDILVIPAGVMMSANLKQRGCPFSRYNVWLSRRFMTFLKLQDDEADYAIARMEKAGHYLLRLPEEHFETVTGGFEALQASTLVGSLNSELSGKTLLSALMVQLNRAVQQLDEKVMVTGSGNRLAAVLTHIHKECTTTLSVENLAEQHGYSPSHLAHSFKKQLGTSLYHYVLLRRLQIGREAMLEGVPVKEAYQRCGFGDYAGFYRSFTKEFGMSPQQYKKRNQ